MSRSSSKVVRRFYPATIGGPHSMHIATGRRTRNAD
jgi:hypothetical protein